MRRREFVIGVGLSSVTLARALIAYAQQRAMPLIGFLNVASADGYQPMVATFRRGLQEMGYVEGQNVAIEYRWADGRTDRLSGLWPSLFIIRLRSLLQPALRRRLRQRQKPQPFRLSLNRAVIPSGSASSLASVTQAATSRA
jgi:hypothetical protein